VEPIDEAEAVKVLKPLPHPADDVAVSHRNHDEVRRSPGQLLTDLE